MKLEERKMAVNQIRLDVHRLGYLVDNAYHHSSVSEAEVLSMVQMTELIARRAAELLKKMREIKP